MAKQPSKKKVAAKKKAAARRTAPVKAADPGYECIITERRGGALIITFNRPDRLNALNEQMSADIIDAMSQVEMDRKITAVILQGSERAFCAGADLGGFSDLPKDRFDNYRARYNALEMRRLFRYLPAYTKPVVSAVEGYCLGGGLEIALWGDLIVAGEAAQFGFPESRHSLIPGAGGTQTLPRLIGRPLAKELMWTARRIGATEAREYRLVNHVTPKGGALAKALELVGTFSQNGPLALMMIKQAIDRGSDMTLDNGFLQEADLSYMLTFSEDRNEGLAAFAEKRRPKFKGQ